MQAIQTKYHGPRDVRGSRVSATAPAGRLYVEWDDALNLDANHLAAATALANKFRWLDGGDGCLRCVLESGTLADGSHVHVLVPVDRLKAVAA